MSNKNSLSFVFTLVILALTACQAVLPETATRPSEATATAAATAIKLTSTVLLPSATEAPTATPFPPTTTPSPPTPTPEPTPIVIFNDSFDSDRQGWAGADTISTRTITNGELSIAFEGNNKSVMFPVPGNLPPDVEVAFEVMVGPESEGAIAGAMCRARDTGDYYWFEIASGSFGGGYGVYKSMAGKETELIAPTLSSAILKAGQVNSVRLLCSGQQLQFSVNDTMLVDITDDSLASGGVVLFTLGAPGSQVVVDNLSVTLPEDVETVAVEPLPALNAGDVILATNFKSLDGWEPLAFSFNDFKRTDKYTLETRANGLYIEVPRLNTSVYALYDTYLGQADVQIDVDIETVAGPNSNNISVLCRSNPKGWYEFSMHSGGRWFIWKYEYDGNDYFLLDSGASTAIHLQKAKNHLTVTCQGDKLNFYVNDVHLTTVTNAQYMDGSVGVSVSSFDISGPGAEFSQFSVTVPDPANPPGAAVAPPVSPSIPANSPSPTPSSSSLSAGPEGLWQGTTSQGGSFSLVVENNAVVRVGAMFTIPDCQISGFDSPVSAPISGGIFSASDPDFDITGTFNVDGTVSGMIVVHPQPNAFVACSRQEYLTWTARK